MRTEKISLKNIKDVLSREEMKNILAGYASGDCTTCISGGVSYTCSSLTVNGRTSCSCPAANNYSNNC